LSGEFYAIACAFFWALSSTLLKSQTRRVEVISLAAWRTVPGVLIHVSLLFLSGRASEVLHLSPRSAVLVVGSTFLGLGLGDLLYLGSMKHIGLARAMPLSATYPFFTVILALLFLDEALDCTIFAGAVLITGGAYLLAFPRGTRRMRSATAQTSANPQYCSGRRPTGSETDLKGVSLALGAAACWAVSTVMMRLGLEGVHLLVANSIRLLLVVTALFAVLFRRGEVGRIGEHGLRPLGVVLLAGAIGTGLGTFTFLSALERAGAAKTSVLTSTTPLFGVPFSLVLGEKLTSRTLLGTVLTMVGVWLTV
jgi:DME family drug/metabolite transporter